MKKSKHGHSNGQESWGRDSGARDLSPDHRPHSSGTGSQMTENEANANELQLINHQSTRADLLELTQRLQRSEHGRNILEQQLRESLQDRDRTHRQLESLAATHESRITEMHCIIVELSKKLKTKEDGVIAEEPEGSVSELSFQEGSVYNSDMEEVNAVESQTEPLDMKLEQPDHRQSACNESLTSFPNLLPAPHFINESGSLNRIDVLQDEVLHLRAQVSLLESQLAASSNKEGGDGGEEPHDLHLHHHHQPADADNSPQLLRARVPPVPVVAMVPKMAERVKLKRTNDQDYITGSEMTNTGVCTTEIAQHLVGDLYRNVGVKAEDAMQLQLEVKQLQRRLEHLRVQNTILSLTVQESKQHCDQLYLLCGKYESNAIGLQQALNYSDRAIEAYDVMLALFESRLDIVQNNPGGVKNKEDAENVAKHLLNHLEGESTIQCSSNSLGPWQDAILLYSEKSKEKMGPWTKEDDFRLRSHISKLKGYRASVQNTIVTLESPFYSDVTSSTSGGGESPSFSKRMDLETAVLMQELMNVTQEVNVFKDRAERAEQEKRVSEEQLKSLQEALLQLQGQMLDDGGQVEQSTAEMERELVDALARESRLKARLQGLAGSVEAATKSSKEKYSQVQSTVAELKHANQTLNHSLEKCRRKYDSKVKRLESQLHDLSLRSGLEVKASLPSPGRCTQKTATAAGGGGVGGEMNSLMTSSVTMGKHHHHQHRTQQHVPETTL